MQTISTANSNLDGTTGTYSGAIITGATGKGTQVQTINIKAQATTTQGMIRLFICDGGTGTAHIKLFKEIPVEATAQSGTDQSFSRRITFGDKGLFLAPSWYLFASTEKGETFNLIAEGVDLAYPA